MALKQDLVNETDSKFTGDYVVTNGTAIPNVADIDFGKNGRELDLAMLFIDIKESTKIVDGFRRKTAAKMYKSFLYGIVKIARANDGELRSFNGDGVLVAFIGGSKCNNAVKAAMQMKYFFNEILKPKVDNYMFNNRENQDINFSFGIGIDVGKVLVVRGGIRGENNNDLVWVGNATNYAVKLSGMATSSYNIYITPEVYSRLNENQGGHARKEIWEKITKQDFDIALYKTSWHWGIE